MQVEEEAAPQRLQEATCFYPGCRLAAGFLSGALLLGSYSLPSVHMESSATGDLGPSQVPGIHQNKLEIPRGWHAEVSLSVQSQVGKVDLACPVDCAGSDEGLPTRAG